MCSGIPLHAPPPWLFDNTPQGRLKYRAAMKAYRKAQRQADEESKWMLSIILAGVIIIFAIGAVVAWNSLGIMPFLVMAGFAITVFGVKWALF